MIDLHRKSCLWWKWLLFMVLAIFYCAGGLATAEDTIAGKQIRAHITPYQKTALSSEISAVISRLPLREGEVFKKGQLLVDFDCALLKAHLSKAEATAEIARQGLQVSQRLEELNSISRLEINQAEAKAKEAEADLQAMKVNTSKCSLWAPYAGRIAKLHVDAYQYVAPGMPLMEILDANHLEIRLIVPSTWLAWLKPEEPFSILIDELNRTYEAQVIRLGAQIDPVSQSLPVIGKIIGQHNELLPGMSGWANFEVAER